MHSPNVAAARALVDAGLRIFPCNSAKKPMVEGWEQATPRSPLWWEANPLALPAIPVGAHGLLVIDCDRKPGRADGVAAFTALCAERQIELSSAFVVETPSGGLHFYWRTDTAFGNSRGSLPDGIDVRGVGGYVIAPGATLPDGRSYRHLAGSWEAIPALPEPLAAFLKAKRPASAPEPSVDRPEATQDERNYAERALADECETLAAMRAGEGRNAALNRAAHSIGTMVGAGWIDPDAAAQALWDAAERNGYRAKDGDAAALKTLQSGLEAGTMKPRDPLSAIEADAPFRESVANLLAAHKAKQSATATAPQGEPVMLVPFSQIAPRAIEWLWKGYLPIGKLTLLAGSGGVGKSTVTCNWAAAITTGGLWPDGTKVSSPRNVLIWSSEDDPSDTIAPRLIAAGADLSRCFFIQGAEKGRSFDPAKDLQELRKMAARIGDIGLLIIDPIMNAIVGDSFKPNIVRRGLQPFVDFASEFRCCVIGISHFAKGTEGRNPAERILSSSAFKDFSRTALVAVQDEETGDCAFARAKTNIAKNMGGFSYRIEEITISDGREAIETTRIVWKEMLEGSARSILAKFEGESREQGEKLTQAKQFLIQSLSAGPVASKELSENAREGHGISNETLRRAKEELGVTATKVGYGGVWTCALPLASHPR